jgi:hypothetical protein
MGGFVILKALRMLRMPAPDVKDFFQGEEEHETGEQQG